MNMFFFKIEKEYGIQKSLLASAWTEFNAATTVEILHLLPEEKQVSNLHITRCQHPITKGDRAGQKCNRPAEKAQPSASVIQSPSLRRLLRILRPTHTPASMSLDVNTGKTCAHRVTVCTNHLKIYDAEHPHTDECVSVCASHLKFYDANYQRLPICTAVAKKSKKKCNRLAEEGTGTCAMHSGSSKTTSESDEPVNTTTATKAKTVQPSQQPNLPRLLLLVPHRPRRLTPKRRPRLKHRHPKKQAAIKKPVEEGGRRDLQ